MLLMCGVLDAFSLNFLEELHYSQEMITLIKLKELSQSSVHQLMKIWLLLEMILQENI